MIFLRDFALLVMALSNTQNEAVSFNETQWSLVMAAAGEGDCAAGAALEELCQTYWPAIYGYLRRKSYSAHDAQDLTQEFFERLLRRNSISKVDPLRGSFRGFLLRDLNFMLIDSWRKDVRVKRGSGEAIISLSAIESEEQAIGEPSSGEPSPSEWFDRRWRIALLQRALNFLRQEFDEAGKGAFFGELREFLIGEPSDGDYQVAAGKLGVSAGSVAVTVHRMRTRFRDIVRREA